MKFNDGDRVNIKPHFWWPEGGIGTATILPEFVAEALEGETEFSGTQRTIAGNDKIIEAPIKKWWQFWN